MTFPRCSVPGCAGLANKSGKCPAHDGKHARQGGRPSKAQIAKEQAAGCGCTGADETLWRKP